jgi:hypothetical protein
MDLLPDFRDLLAEFARCGVEAVLVGGYAVALHGHPRSTKEHGSARPSDSASGTDPTELRGVFTRVAGV